MIALIFIGIGLAFLVMFAISLFQRPDRSSRAERKAKKMAQQPATKITVTSSDISAIAGDDVMATQLDLARAYIETGRHVLAKKILEYVREHGNDFQRTEAHRLLDYI